MRDCERVGGKVVDHAEALEADITTEGFNRERPCMVCECDLVARYRRGNRQYGVSRPRRWRLLSQICVNRIGKRRVVVQCVYPRRGCGAVRLDQRETCVRGADISPIRPTSGMFIKWSPTRRGLLRFLPRRR